MPTVAQIQATAAFRVVQLAHRSVDVNRPALQHICHSVPHCEPSAPIASRRLPQLGGVAHVLLHRPLTPAEECGTILAWQQLMFGLALPLLAQLALESRLWVQHEAQRRRRGLPPERSLVAPLYHVVHGMADLETFHAFVLCMLLSATLHLLAVAISVD